MIMTYKDVIRQDHAMHDLAPLLNKFKGNDATTKEIKEEILIGYYEADKIMRWIEEHNNEIN